MGCQPLDLGVRLLSVNARLEIGLEHDILGDVEVGRHCVLGNIGSADLGVEVVIGHSHDPIRLLAAGCKQPDLIAWAKPRERGQGTIGDDAAACGQRAIRRLRVPLLKHQSTDLRIILGVDPQDRERKLAGQRGCDSEGTDGTDARKRAQLIGQGGGRTDVVAPDADRRGNEQVVASQAALQRIEESA